MRGFIRSFVSLVPLINLSRYACYFRRPRYVNIRCTCGAYQRHFRFAVFRTREVLTGARRCSRFAGRWIAWRLYVRTTASVLFWFILLVSCALLVVTITLSLSACSRYRLRVTRLTRKVISSFIAKRNFLRCIMPIIKKMSSVQ